MGIFVRFLGKDQSINFIANYLRNYKSNGLMTQYFIAYDILKDYKASVKHGVKDKPDIKLSDPKLLEHLVSKLDQLISNISTNGNIEVKKISWGYKNFSNAIYSAKNRNQTQYLLIVVSPILRITSTENIMFNNLTKGIFSVLVIIMSDIEASETHELWDEISIDIDKQLNSNEKIIPFPKTLYDAFMFVKTNDLNNKIVKLENKVENLENKVDDSNKRLENKVENLENKVENLENKVENLENKVENLENKIDDNNKILNLIFDLLKKNNT